MTFRAGSVARAVLITCEICLLPVDGVELRRSLDPEVEMEVLSPR